MNILFAIFVLLIKTRTHTNIYLYVEIILFINTVRVPKLVIKIMFYKTDQMN